MNTHSWHCLYVLTHWPRFYILPVLTYFPLLYSWLSCNQKYTALLLTQFWNNTSTSAVKSYWSLYEVFHDFVREASPELMIRWNVFVQNWLPSLPPFSSLSLTPSLKKNESHICVCFEGWRDRLNCVDPSLNSILCCCCCCSLIRNNTNAPSSFICSFESLKISLKSVGAWTLTLLHDPFHVKRNIFLIYQTQGEWEGKKFKTGIAFRGFLIYY